MLPNIDCDIEVVHNNFIKFNVYTFIKNQTGYQSLVTNYLHYYEYQYTGDLNTRLAWYSNGQKYFFM